MWINPGENGLDKNGRSKQNNKIDDDGNGFVDDVHGWDFVLNSSQTTDSHGHGTHIAGIVSTITAHSRIMSLRYYGEQDSDLHDKTGRRLVQAIDYAVKSGADIINISGGGAGKSPEEEEALRKAWKAGVLVIAAAGNEGQDLDKNPFYPASYDLPNIIAVGSTTARWDRATKTNYSSSQRLVQAIGENVVSYLPHGKIGRMSGTSQATARVAGIVASILSGCPRGGLDADLMKDRLLAAMNVVQGKRVLDLNSAKREGIRKPGQIVDFDEVRKGHAPDRKMAHVEENL